jgi:crotonobetainyl-CoA:carnitine CoA-transferase CaiB-like acyl-CoA transferase
MFDSDRFWPGFCNALSIKNLGEQHGYATAAGRAENSTELIQDLTEIFLSKSSAEWGAKLDEEGCIWAPVKTLDESIIDPQIKANDYTSTIENSYETEIEIIKAPFKISGEDTNPIAGAPILGQHTEEKLLQAGYSWNQIGKFKEEGAII